MIVELDGIPAIGWAMYQPKWLAPNGREYPARVFQVMLVDNYVVIGKGPTAKALKYRITKHDDAIAAQSYAVAQTEDRETRGYTISYSPRMKMVDGPGRRAFLEEQRTNRGPADELAAAMSVLLSSGVKLED